MSFSTSRSAVILLLTTLVLMGSTAPCATAFQSPLVVTTRGVTYSHKTALMRTTPLFESPEDPVDTPSEAAEEVPVLAAKEDEEASYPIDLPSPVLLGTSMILAIAATGRYYEATTHDTQIYRTPHAWAFQCKPDDSPFLHSFHLFSSALAAPSTVHHLPSRFGL
jgi:hypothetical protein